MSCDACWFASRLHTLATLLPDDHVVKHAVSQMPAHIYDVLRGQREQLKADGTPRRDLQRIRSLRGAV